MKSCTRHTFVRCWLVLFSLLVLFSSCHQKQMNTDTTHVLVIWPSTEDDEVYQYWTSVLQDAFAQQDLNVELHCFYAHQGMRNDTLIVQQLYEQIADLESQHKVPSLVLSYGDYLHWLINWGESHFFHSVPVVYFGLHHPDYLASIQNQDERDSTTHSHQVRIIEDFNIQKNLDMADEILALCGSSQSSESPGKKPQHRFCTLLDPLSNWLDACTFTAIEKQLSVLDSTHYLNDFYSVNEEDTLKAFNNQGGIVFSCRSILDPKFNINPDLKQTVATQWAFYPQRSPNHYLQVKHDAISRNCTEGPSFEAFFTCIAEGFMVNNNCLGGFFTVFEDQACDAVNAGKALLAGQTAKQIGILHHHPDFYLNWEVADRNNIALNRIPDYVNVLNVSFFDRYPLLYVTMLSMGCVFFVLLMVYAFLFSRKSIRKNKKNSHLLRLQAIQAIQDQQILKQTINSSGAFLWNDEEQNYTLLSCLKLNDFYEEKLSSFLKQEQDGRYSMQLQGELNQQGLHWYELRMFVSHDRHDRIIRKGILVNIDQQKKLESQRFESHRLLINAKTREGFISSMYHEIRTPLNAVVGYAQVLSLPGMEYSSEELALYSATIETNAALLKKMINDLLLVTLMNNSNIAAQCEKVLLISQMQTSLWPDAIALTKRRNNVVRFEHDIAGLTVQTDPKLLAVVMENLINNASKFSDEGSTITIGWGIKDNGTSTSSQNEVEIWVKDEGIGIEPKHHEIIFDRFFKINSFVPGCGLGLYISKTYVEKMGGTISVESQHNQGSTFRITLKR